MSRKEVPRAGLVQAALAGKITNAEGARALRLTVRQFQRLKARVRAAGGRGLLHRRRGQPSPRRLPPELRQQVVTLRTTTYEGFNDVHLTEKLQELHTLPVSRATVRRLRLALGRAPRRRRERAPAMGQLVQLDASPFAWFEARGPLATLHGLIDDATSGPLALWFRPTEDVHGYLSVLGQACRAYGVPVTLYGDRLSLFQRNDPHWSLEEDLRGHQDPTHFGRVLEELGIGFLQAQSPQAKGRIERLWGTLQDRLVSELRLRGVATLEAANAFLPTFLADFVRRFACPPATPAPAWRPAPRDLERLLSCRYQRTVARDNTVRLGPRCVQLPPGPRGRSHAGGRVEVRELLDGRLLVFAHGALLATQPAPGPDFVLTPRRAAGDARRQAARQRRRRTRQLHQALARLATVARPRPGGARTAVEAGGRSLDTPGPTTRPSPRAPPPREPAATAPRSLWTPPRTHPWRRGVTPRGRALRAAWKG